MTRARNLSRLANATVLTVDGSNNVGIGSTIPDVKLDVIGDAEISGVITATSFSGSGSGLTGVASTDNIITSTASTMADIYSTGIVTATTFVGALTGNASGSSGSCSGNAAGLTGSPNITINNLVGVAATFSGVVTYEDVTNVDSVGIITAQSYVSIADSIVHTGDIDTSLRFPSADTFTVETGGSERLRIDSSGNAKIGPWDETSASGEGFTLRRRGQLLQQLKSDTSEASAYVLNKGTTAKVTFTPDGAATFAGNIETTGGELLIGPWADNDAAAIYMYRGANVGDIICKGDGSADRAFTVMAGGWSGGTDVVAATYGDGSAMFAGPLVVGDTAATSTWIKATRSDAGNVWSGNSATAHTSEITKDGDAMFAGSVKIGGTAAANEIDEYEEGTWTPEFSFSTGQVGSFTYTNRSASYTKIGRLVTVHIMFLCSGIPTAGTDLQCTLPFAPADTLAGTSLDHVGSCIAYYAAATGGSYAIGTSGTTNAHIIEQGVDSDGGGGYDSMDYDDIESTFSIRATMSYCTA